MSKPLSGEVSFRSQVALGRTNEIQRSSIASLALAQPQTNTKMNKKVEMFYVSDNNNGNLLTQPIVEPSKTSGCNGGFIIGSLVSSCSRWIWNGIVVLVFHLIIISQHVLCSWTLKSDSLTHDYINQIASIYTWFATVTNANSYLKL